MRRCRLVQVYNEYSYLCHWCNCCLTLLFSLLSPFWWAYFHSSAHLPPKHIYWTKKKQTKQNNQWHNLNLLAMPANHSISSIFIKLFLFFSLSFIYAVRMKACYQHGTKEAPNFRWNFVQSRWPHFDCCHQTQLKSNNQFNLMGISFT